jgi:hypothetical protein
LREYALVFGGDPADSPTGCWRTSKTFAVGDLVNVPRGETGGDPGAETDGFIWRVVGITEPNTLTLEYVHPWREGDPRCCD